MTTILIATIHEWNINNFKSWQPPKGFKKNLVSDRKELTLKKIKKINPRYIFFPHWSWIIPEEIYKNYECIVFHMTDLPFGRGGSPLQNLIVRGIYETKISAIRAEKEFDAGPVYLKEPLNIEYGSAEDIFKLASKKIYRMINRILVENPAPIPQKGKVVNFERRKPSESRIANHLNPKQLFDFIRMLDAPGYPNAFLEFNEYKIEFSNAELSEEEVGAKIKIRRKESP